MASRPTTSTHWALRSKGSRWALSSSVRLWILPAWRDRAEVTADLRGAVSQTQTVIGCTGSSSGNNERLHSQFKNCLVQRYVVLVLVGEGAGAYVSSLILTHDAGSHAFKVSYAHFIQPPWPRLQIYTKHFTTFPQIDISDFTAKFRGGGCWRLCPQMSGHA